MRGNERGSPTGAMRVDGVFERQKQIIIIIIIIIKREILKNKKSNGREEMGQPVSLQVGVWIENKNEKWGRRKWGARIV